VSANPQAANPAADETVVLRDSFLPAGRGAPMGNGWSWIAAAWSIFRRAAGIWIGMTLVLFVLFVVLGFIPFIGPIALSILWPVFVAGLVLTSRTIDQGGEAQFSQLFAGFRHRFGTLIALGVISLVIGALIIGVTVAATGVKLYALLSTDTDPGQWLAASMTMALAGLIILALMVPLAMATWFAPALIVFHEVGAWGAMKASFVGSLKNVLPFFLYGLLLMLAGIIASIPLGLGWLVLAPVIAASVYTAYRDIYFEA
jgi:uncharacterized membrane protein